jgi:hypothetical protein
MRANFEIEQTIAIASGDSCFDLHNCFDFVGFQYLPSHREASFEWERTQAPRVPDGLPARLFLVFDGVSNFAVRRRDDEMPFTEDDCVESISFLPPELDADFDSICPEYRSDSEHMRIGFQSGACVKIWADSVRQTTVEPNPPWIVS